MTCFSSNPIFDLATYAIHVCFLFIPYLELHKSLIEIRWKEAKQCLGEEPHTLSDLKEIFWGARLCFNLKIFQKLKFSEQEKWRWLDSNLFHFSNTQDGVIDTSKFTCVGEAWNNLDAGIIPFEEMFHLSPWTLLEDKQRAKCGRACWWSFTPIFNRQLSNKIRSNECQT